MKVTEVKYSKKCNLGNYESEEYSVTAALDEGCITSAAEALMQLKAMVASVQSNEPQEEKVEPTPDRSKDKAPKKAPKIEETEDVIEAQEPDENDEVVDNSSDSDSDDDVEAIVKELEEEELDTPPPKKKSKKAAKETDEEPKKKVRKKNEPYDRGSAIHRKLFGDSLTAYDKNWNGSPKSKAAGTETSKALEGVEFLDAEGKVIPSFIKSLRETYVKFSPKKK